MRHELAMEPRLLVAAAVFLYLLYGVYLQLDQGLTYSSHELFSTSDRSDTNPTNLRIWCQQLHAIADKTKQLSNNLKEQRNGHNCYSSAVFVAQ